MLKQHGGEGKEKYKGNKSDMKLVQHGGEGKNIGVKPLDVDFTPGRNPDPSYTGPGRNLKSEQY